MISNLRAIHPVARSKMGSRNSWNSDLRDEGSTIVEITTQLRRCLEPAFAGLGIPLSLSVS